MAPLGIPRAPTLGDPLRPPAPRFRCRHPSHLAASERARGLIVPTSLCSPASPSPAALLARPPTSRLTSSLGRAPLTRCGRGRMGCGSEPGAPPAPASGSSRGRTLRRRSAGPWPRPSSGSSRRRPCCPSPPPAASPRPPRPFPGPWLALPTSAGSRQPRPRRRRAAPAFFPGEEAALQMLAPCTPSGLFEVP